MGIRAARLMTSSNIKSPKILASESAFFPYTEFANKLGMTRAAISRVVNGKAGISPELAVRLAAFLNVTARSWLTMQAEYDLWQIRNKRRPKIERFEEAIV